MIYGTAWKEDETARLVKLALDAGFRHIDTANQRKHYFEAAVGEGVRGFPREQLWLQTKFTFLDGQDARLPYDPKASVTKQVEQSAASSLEHLGTSFIDSYVLHGPSRRSGWNAPDVEAWSAMEALHERGTVKALGVSNVSLDQLEALWSKARVKPSWVQNRCYARFGWDAPVRTFCRANGIGYQGFSLLTANPDAVRAAKPIAAKHGVTPEQVIFAFSRAAGMTPLTGTTDPLHMKQDLASAGLKLSEDEVKLLG